MKIQHGLSAASIARHTMARERKLDAYGRFEEQLSRSLATPAPASTQLLEPSDLSPSPLRPSTLDEIVGQEQLKPLFHRLIDNAHGAPLDPVLLVGASGTGKTTMARALAHDLGTRIFALKAPVDLDTLDALRRSAKYADVVFIDEIHMQVSGDRRGLTAACDPESFYMLLEDGVLATATGPLKFPAVTWIGATTDVGLLPEPLSARFPLQPQLEPYTADQLRDMAHRSLAAVGLDFGPDVLATFADASRANPRQLNAYVRAAHSLVVGKMVDRELAVEVVTGLCSTTLDGLTKSMQTVLTFLYTHCRRDTRQGVVFTASVNTLATACGHGRDTKAISLLVEPYLLQRGLIEVRPSGRTLTNAGIQRARQLIGG